MDSVTRLPNFLGVLVLCSPFLLLTDVTDFDVSFSSVSRYFPDIPKTRCPAFQKTRETAWELPAGEEADPPDEEIDQLAVREGKR